jgi:hypothetical protein
VLATLIAYLAVRRRWCEGSSRWWPAIGLAAILGTGGALGILFKETAFNLVIYVGLIEYLLLKRPDDGMPLKVFRWSCVVAPMAAFIAFVAMNWPGFMQTFRMREFTLSERVLTAPRILADYLWHAMVPLPSWLGPYHDDYVASRSWLDPVSTLTAAGFWLALVAIALAARKRQPVIALAVLWFIGGHLIEAGPFALELYFEHRNYLPLFGPMLLLGVLPWLTPPPFHRLAGAGVAVLGLMFGLGLAQSADLWGRPFAAAEVWVRSHPQSLRAAQYYAQSFFVRGLETDAAEAIAAAAQRQPNSAGLILANLQLHCSLPDAAKLVPMLADQVLVVAPAASFEFSAVETIAKVTGLQTAGKCPGLDPQRLLDVSAALLANGKYASRRDAVGYLHYQRARLYLAQRNLAATISELDAAFAADPDIDTISLAVVLLWDAGLRDEAKLRLELARHKLPVNRILRRQWMDKLGELELLMVKQ